MRIAIFHPSDESYGADRVMVQGARDLVAAGHEVRVWLPRDVQFRSHPVCDSLADAGIEARHIDLPVLRREYMTLGGMARLIARLLRLMPALCRIARQSDVVYLNTSAALLVAPVAALCGARVLLHLHESWRPSEAVLLNALALPCSRILAVSHAITHPLNGRNRARTSVVYNGLVDIAPSERSPGKPLTLLMASRWNDWKGHRTLAEAWHSGIPGWRLVILGGPPPSGRSEDVPALFGDAGDVSIIGEVDDVVPYVDRADLVAIPSDLPDPLPTIGLEALRAGVPIIAASHGGLPEIVGEQAGWLFEPRDAEALRETLVSIIPSDLAQRGREGRRRFVSLFEASLNRDRFLAAVTGQARTP
jgi:glycosyltransferase involved in cell wall biosynthesis